MADTDTKMPFSKDAEKIFLRGKDHIITYFDNKYFEWKTDVGTISILNEIAEEIRKKSKLPGARITRYEFYPRDIGPVLERRGRNETDTYEVGTLIAKKRHFGAPDVYVHFLNQTEPEENKELDMFILLGVANHLHEYKEKSWNQRHREMNVLDTILFPGNWRSNRNANLGNAAPGRRALPKDVANIIKEFVGVNKNLRNPLSRLTNTRRNKNKTRTNRNKTRSKV